METLVVVLVEKNAKFRFCICTTYKTKRKIPERILIKNIEQLTRK